jgi:hypothetical protein
LQLFIFSSRVSTATGSSEPEISSGICVENFPLTNPSKVYDVTIDATIRHARGCDDKVDAVSVTKVLKATMSVERRLALQRWEERLVREMGRQKFEEMQQLTLTRGERLHSAIQV